MQILLHRVVLLLPNPDPALWASAEHVIGRLANAPSTPTLEPFFLLQDGGLAQRDALLTCQLLCHWLGTYVGIHSLELAGVLGPVVAHVWEGAWRRQQAGPCIRERRIVQLLASGSTGMQHLIGCGESVLSSIKAAPCLCWD
jgi:hypothetical protein